MHYTFRRLQKEDIPAMHQAFLQAFADYQLPFQLSFDQFVQKFIYKLNINYELSVGAFFQNQLIGFIFSSTGFYRGKYTAYNGGTGVIPKHRGYGLTQKMYEYLFPKLIEKGITQAVLEVLTENEKAIKSYVSCGFSIFTKYHCYKLTKLNSTLRLPSPQVTIRPVSQPNWPLYESFFDTTPYFLDSTAVLKHNLQHEEMVEARLGSEVVGYIIFQPMVSRISQVAVDKKHRGKGIGKMLLDYALKASPTKALTILNVGQKETELIKILGRIGFEHTVDQFEMLQEF